MTGENLSELTERIRSINAANGWREDVPDNIRENPVEVIARLALITTEVAEAIEEARVGAVEAYEGPGGKPEGLPSELADVIIRTLDVADILGIDIGYEVHSKLLYNETRTHRHGGKLF